jgi:cell division protein FtsB
MSKMNELEMLEEENEKLWAHNMQLQKEIATLKKDKDELAQEYVLLKAKLNFTKQYGILNLEKFAKEN